MLNRSLDMSKVLLGKSSNLQAFGIWKVNPPQSPPPQLCRIHVICWIFGHMGLKGRVPADRATVWLPTRAASQKPASNHRCSASDRPGPPGAYISMSGSRTQVGVLLSHAQPLDETQKATTPGGERPSAAKGSGTDSTLSVAAANTTSIKRRHGLPKGCACTEDPKKPRTC